MSALKTITSEPLRASIRSFRKVVIDHSLDFGTDKKALLGEAKEALERTTLKITKNVKTCAHVDWELFPPVSRSYPNSIAYPAVLKVSSLN